MHYAELVEQHGYTITLFGSMLEGEFLLLLSGMAAHRGYMVLWWAIAAGAAGGFIGGEVLFGVGRLYGARLLARFPQLRPAARRVNALLARRAPWAILAVRFVYGLRTFGPVVVGMSRVGGWTFALYNAIGAILWSTCFVLAGYFIGEALTTFLGDLRHLEREAAVAVVLVAIAIAIIYRWRRHRRWSRSER
jgi:membrane protein DedA with SNARE-associated domain